MRYAVLAALLVAGCATPEDKFDAAWPSLNGKSVRILIQRWGEPSKVVSPETAWTVYGHNGPVYWWETKTDSVYTTSATSTGTIGTVPITVTTTTPQAETLLCSVRVMATNDNRIARLTYNGARGACRNFSDRL